ncbi:MAG: undecaprenyl-diphosphate phosphatase [Candidatus Acidiferrales bacterium]
MHLKHSEYARQSVRVSEISTHSGTATGFVVSFIVAYGSVAWFMAYVRRRGFVPFAIYRLIVGAAVLFWIAKLST